MIIVRMKNLFYFFGFVALICIPFLAPVFTTADSESGYMDVAKAAYVVPIIVAAEILIYFLFGLLSGRVKSVFRLIFYCVFMAFLRFLTCFVGGSIFATMKMSLLTYSIFLFWVGNPIVVLMQAFMLILFGVHIETAIGFDLLDDEGKRMLGSEHEKTKQKNVQHLHAGGIPAGGFIRVYSFPELGRLFSNIIGMEGYIFYSGEGLILWRDCQLRIDLERLVVISQKEWNCLSEIQGKSDFGPPVRFITQTRENQFVHISFGPMFYAVLIFKPEIDMGETLERLKLLERSALELFDMKYSRLK
jgi:hypothetical protein